MSDQLPQVLFIPSILVHIANNLSSIAVETEVNIKVLNKSFQYFLRGYLLYKTIFGNKVAPDEQLMNFFYLKKKCFVLEIFRFLCFCKIRRFQNL